MTCKQTFRKKKDEICQSNKYRELLTKYHKFIEDNNAENTTFRNWSSFIEMFEVLLLYIRLQEKVIRFYI